MRLHIIDLIHIFIGVEVLCKTVELKSKLCDRVIDHHRLSADFKSLLHDILIEHRPQLPVLQSKGFQNILTDFDHGQFRIIDLPAVNLIAVFVHQRVIITVLTGLHRKDSILSDLPCGFIAHNFRLRHIACTVALHNLCKLADMKHIVSNLCVVLVDECTRLYDGLIGIVNLDAATVRNTEQVLIVAVDKSDFLTIRVVLICHLRFPPFSNSILNFVLPSSDTSIKTMASKVLPVLSDLQFLSFTLPEPSSFCAVAEVMLLPILAK